MSKTTHIIGTVIALLCVIGCAIVMLVATQKDIITYYPVPVEATYNTIAGFTAAANQSFLVQDQTNEAKWASLPAGSNEKQQVDVRISEYNSYTDGNVFYTGNSLYQFNLTFAWEDPVYSSVTYGCPSCFKDVFKAKPVRTLVPDAATTEAIGKKITTVNYDAMSTMYKIMNPPKYSQTWQPVAQTIDKMNSQSFQLFLYAPFLNANYFNTASAATIELDVVGTNGAGLSAADSTIIVNDPQYGMTCTKCLTYWTQASLLYATGSGADSYLVLQQHFASLTPSLVITDAQMLSMVGPSSQLKVQINTLESEIKLILGSSGLPLVPTVNAYTLAAAQWSTGLILAGFNGFTGCSALTFASMQDLGMNFPAQPEMSFTSSAFDYSTQPDLILSMLNNRDVASPDSLANPTNMYNGWYGSVSGAGNTFSSLTDAQYNAIGKWSSSLLTDYQGLATANTKSLEQSIAYMNSTFLVELASRNMAYLLNNGDGTIAATTCGALLNFGSVSAADQVTVCAAYPETDLANVRVAVKGTWYGASDSENPAYATMKAETGMNVDQMVAFYDDTVPNTFGWYLKQVLAAESTKYGCVNAANCTVTDTLINTQWGASAITQNPLYTAAGVTDTYTPVSFSMCAWGTTFTTPNCMYPPEVAAYSHAPYNNGTDYVSLTPAQVNLIQQQDYSWYGYNNIYNTMLLMQSFINYGAPQTSPDAYWTATSAQYGWSAPADSGNLYAFMQSMRLHVLNYLLEGPTKEYTVSDLINGYETTLNAKLNTGSLAQGNLYVDGCVTPVLNWWKGPASGHTFTVFTGQGAPSKVGAIYQMDDSNQIWLTNQMYSAVAQAFVPVPWYNEANGMVQTFAIPGLEQYSNMGFRLPYQSTQAMGVTTVNAQIDFSSLSWATGYYQPLSYAAYYQMTDTYGNVTQELGQATWSDAAAPANTWRDQATYQLPVSIGQGISTFANLASYSNNTYDLQSGYAMKANDVRSHFIMQGGYFKQFLTSLVQYNSQAISVVNQTFYIDNTTAFVDTMYPGNGTTTYQITTRQAESIDQQLNAPLLVSLACIAGVFIVVACMFIACYYKAEDENQESQDVSTGNSGFRNINNQEAEKEETVPMIN